jgi:hypothetical protein
MKASAAHTVTTVTAKPRGRIRHRCRDSTRGFSIKAMNPPTTMASPYGRQTLVRCLPDRVRSAER